MNENKRERDVVWNEKIQSARFINYYCSKNKKKGKETRKRKRKRMRLMIMSALITIFCIQPYNANRAKKETISNERSNKEIEKEK